MKKLITHFSLLLVFLFFSLSIFGQNKTYLGIEVGPKLETYHHIDNGDGLFTPAFFYSPIVGLTIGQEINNNFLVETGIYFNDYGESYRLKGELGYSSSDAVFMLNIPLRLRGNFHPFKNLEILKSISISPSLGIQWGMIPFFFEDDTGSGFGSSSSGSFTFTTEESSYYNIQQHFLLFEGGITLEKNYENGAKLFGGFNYVAGWKKIIHIDVTYTINNLSPQTAEVYSNGGYSTIIIGFKYPINKLWQKKVLNDEL